LAAPANFFSTACPSHVLLAASAVSLPDVTLGQKQSFP
jgi:hypothetical protein